MGRVRATCLKKMRESKREYHYAVRRLKRRQNALRNKKFLEAIAEDRTRDFFTEVKKMNPKPPPPPLMDGMSSDNDIAMRMSEKYRQLYNSIPSNPEQLKDINDRIEKRIKDSDVRDCFVSLMNVQDAIKKLKPEKGDGDQGFSSSHLKLSSVLFRARLASLFTAMWIHGHQPNALLNASIISIPKDTSKSLCDSSNYRGIALCCSIAKAYDLIFLQRNTNALSTDDLQFAFKKKMGTTMCTLALKEVVQYYFNQKSEVYACFLDCTKAFD